MRKKIVVIGALMSAMALSSVHAAYGDTIGGHRHREIHSETIETHTFTTSETSSSKGSSSSIEIPVITKKADKDNLLIDVREEKHKLPEFDETIIDNDNTFYDKGAIALVREGKLWGIFGTDEKISVIPKYKKIEGKDGGIFLAENDKKEKKYIDSKGNVISDIDAKKIMRMADGIVAYKEGKLYGFKNPDGSVMIAPRYKKVLTNFSEGIAFVIDENDENIAINEEGKELFKNPYNDIEDYKYGVAEFHRKVNSFKAKTWLGVIITSKINDVDADELADKNTYKGKKRGYIDTKGNLVINSKNDAVYPMTPYGTFVRNGNKTKFITKDGTELLKEGYYEVGSIVIEEGLVAIKDKKLNAYAVFSMEDGKFTTNFEYDDILLLGQNRMVATIDNRNIYMDAKNEKVLYILPKDVHIKQFGNTPYTWIYERGEFFAIIDTKGNIVYKDENIQDANIFKNGYARVKKNGKWGIIDTNGNLVLPANYKDIVML